METQTEEQRYLQAVRDEIENIRLNATAEEKARLDFESFNARNEEHCYYGQMTGNCNNKRAIEMMPKKVIINYFGYSDELSPLENYGMDMSTSAILKDILLYIKGEVDTLPKLILTL